MANPHPLAIPVNLHHSPYHTVRILSYCLLSHGILFPTDYLCIQHYSTYLLPTYLLYRYYGSLHIHADICTHTETLWLMPSDNNNSTNSTTIYIATYLPGPPSPCLNQSLLAKSRPHATIWTGSLAAPLSSSSIISHPTICID